MKRAIVDCGSGTLRTVPMTAEEIAFREAEEAAWLAGSADRYRQEVISRLAQSDHRMTRVTEDLITVLVQKGQLALTDLPAEAVNLLAERVRTRGELAV